jgi:hypothetical protein
MTTDQDDEDMASAIQDALLEGDDTVWIYVDTSKQVGDKDHLKVFADQDAARKWFGEHDREGVAFEYPVFD